MFRNLYGLFRICVQHWPSPKPYYLIQRLIVKIHVKKIFYSKFIFFSAVSQHCLPIPSIVKDRSLFLFNMARYLCLPVLPLIWCSRTKGAEWNPIVYGGRSQLTRSLTLSSCRLRNLCLERSAKFPCSSSSIFLTQRFVYCTWLFNTIELKSKQSRYLSTIKFFFI